jgi:calcineurin-like phosphoesterase family protein
VKRAIRTLLVAGPLGLGLVVAACSSSSPTQPSTGASTGSGGAGAGGGGGEGGGFVCPDSGVDKGPWSLAVNGTSATIRWEACRSGIAGEVLLTPEKGGAEVTSPSVETSFTVENTYVAPLAVEAPPDYAGTYFMHEAKLDGLAPATCYTYHLAAEPGRKGRFCTAHPPGDTFSFMAIGDTNPGLGTFAHDVLEHVLPKNPEFTVHGGDIQYYDSELETWASWFPVMQPMLSQGAIFPAIGNHESEMPDEYLAYTQRYFGGAGFDGKKGYYRFTSGGVWFFILDTQDSLASGSEQATWLEAELSDASKQPGFRFSVVDFHKPWVTCGDTADAPDLRAFYEPVFAKYGVTLVIQAHMHGYERFELGAFTYLTAAGGGGLIGNPSENTQRDYCDKRVASGRYRHAVMLEVSPGKLSGTVIDDQGMVRDTFVKVVP